MRFLMTGRARMGESAVAILGGRGMLGTDLSAELERRGVDFAVYDLPEFDITDAGQVREVVGGSDAIVNCAAYTNVDGAESESELAHRVNGEAVGVLGEIAGRQGKWVLHISTDFVFDGAKDGPYVETDEPRPINEYGKSKLAGERLLAASGCAHCIIRVEWTYGRAGRNFVTKLLELSRQRSELKVVDDQKGSPTATTEAAAAICDCIGRRVEGLYHFAAAGYTTRFEMARFIFDRLGGGVNIVPCSSSEFAGAAARPLNSCFDCSKIAAVLAEPIRPWREPLAEFVESL